MLEAVVGDRRLDGAGRDVEARLAHSARSQHEFVRRGREFLDAAGDVRDAPHAAGDGERVRRRRRAGNRALVAVHAGLRVGVPRTRGHVHFCQVGAHDARVHAHSRRISRTVGGPDERDRPRAVLRERACAHRVDWRSRDACLCRDLRGGSRRDLDGQRRTRRARNPLSEKVFADLDPIRLVQPVREENDLADIVSAGALVGTAAHRTVAEEVSDLRGARPCHLVLGQMHAGRGRRGGHVRVDAIQIGPSAGNGRVHRAARVEVAAQGSVGVLRMEVGNPVCTGPVAKRIAQAVGDAEHLEHVIDAPDVFHIGAIRLLELHVRSALPAVEVDHRLSGGVRAHDGIRGTCDVGDGGDTAVARRAPRARILRLAHVVPLRHVTVGVRRHVRARLQPEHRRVHHGGRLRHAGHLAAGVGKGQRSLMHVHAELQSRAHLLGG